MEPELALPPEVVDLSQVNLAVLMEDMESVCAPKGAAAEEKGFLWCSRAALGYNGSTKTSSVVNKSKSSLESNVAGNAARAQAEEAAGGAPGEGSRGAEIEKKLNCTLDDLMHPSLRSRQGAGLRRGRAAAGAAGEADLDEDDNDSTCGLVNIGSYSSFNMCENPSDLWFGLKMSDGTPVVINSRSSRPAVRRRAPPGARREFGRRGAARSDLGLRDVRRRRHSGPIDYSRGFLSLSKYMNHA